MRYGWIVPLLALAAGCGGEVKKKKPRSTEVVKPPKPKPRKKAKKGSHGPGYAFGEDEKAGGPKRVADPRRTIGPPMEAADALMRQAAAEEAPRRRWVCEVCGDKSDQPGVHCGKDRVPLK